MLMGDGSGNEEGKANTLHPTARSKPGGKKVRGELEEICKD